MRITALSSILLTAFNISIAFAQSGTLDVSFGNQGKATATFQPPEDVGRKAVIQADGKIVQAGYSVVEAAYPYKYAMALVRYNTNGVLDSTFDQDGKITTIVTGYNDEAYDLAIQQDGKIVVAGDSYDKSSESGGTSRFTIVRYNNDGTLDSTFNKNGKVTTSIGNADDVAYTLAIQSDEKILVAGFSTQQQGTDFALARYNTDGSLDKSFSTDGKVTTPIGSGNEGVFSITLQPDGKILAAGFSFNGSDYDFALVRYNTNGSLDKSFGGDGKVTTAIGDADDPCFSVALQKDGKIVAAGYLVENGHGHFALVRYNVDGSLDKSFGNEGKVKTILGMGNDLGSSVAIQADGKIVVAGTSDNGNNRDFAVVRYDTNGIIDNSFDGDGKVFTDFDNSDDDVASLVFTKDGKMLVAGTTHLSTTSTPQSIFAVARYDGYSVLPVNLTSFTSTNTGKSVVLSWQISELNSAYFSLERSNNSINFLEIARVKSKANSSQMQRYSYEDFSFFKGENYYRLKQVDNDGRFTYSEKIRVNFISSTTIRLYPNPVKNMVIVSGLNASSTSTISIVDPSGRIIKRISTTRGSFALNTQSLRQGVYYLKVEEDKKTKTLQFIKE